MVRSQLSRRFVVRPHDCGGFVVFDRLARTQSEAYRYGILAAIAAEDLNADHPWPSDAARRNADAMDELDAYQPIIPRSGDPFDGISGAHEGDDR